MRPIGDMKMSLLVLSAILLAELSIADQSPLLNQEFPLLILEDGTTFTNARITRIEPDAATIRHPGGISRVALERFNVERREAMGYDEESATQARKLRRELENRMVFANISSPYLTDITPADLVRPLSEIGFLISASECAHKRKWICSKTTGNTEFEIEITAPCSHDRVSGFRCLALDHLHLNVAQEAQPLFELLLNIVFSDRDPAPAEDWLAGTILEGNGKADFEDVRANMVSVARNVRLLQIRPGCLTHER